MAEEKRIGKVHLKNCSGVRNKHKSCTKARCDVVCYLPFLWELVSWIFNTLLPCKLGGAWVKETERGSLYVLLRRDTGILLHAGKDRIWSK